MAKMPMTRRVCLRCPAIRRGQSFHGYERRFYKLPQAVEKESEEGREVRGGASQGARGYKCILQWGDLPQTASSSTSLLVRKSLSPCLTAPQSAEPKLQVHILSCLLQRLSRSPLPLFSRDTAGGARASRPLPEEAVWEFRGCLPGLHTEAPSQWLLEKGKSSL